MKQIRSNIFETNSSSSHTFTCSKKGMIPLSKSRQVYSKDIYKGNDVHIKFDCYGWTGPDICITKEKLNYIVQLIFDGIWVFPERKTNINDLLGFVRRNRYNNGECVTDEDLLNLAGRIVVVKNLIKKIDKDFDPKVNKIYIEAGDSEYNRIDHNSCCYTEYLYEDFSDSLIKAFAEFVLDPKSKIIYYPNEDTNAVSKIYDPEVDYAWFSIEDDFLPNIDDPSLFHRYVRHTARLTGQDFGCYKHDNGNVTFNIEYKGKHVGTLKSKSGFIAALPLNKKVKEFFKLLNKKDFIKFKSKRVYGLHYNKETRLITCLFDDDDDFKIEVVNDC